MPKQNMQARWRVASVRSDDGQFAGFGVWDGERAQTLANVVEILPDESRAAHLAHALEQVDAGALHRLYPVSLIRRAARCLPLQ